MTLTRQQALDHFTRRPHRLGFERRGASRLHPEEVVTYIIDRNINYTNFCTEYCTSAPSTGRSRSHGERRLHPRV